MLCAAGCGRLVSPLAVMLPLGGVLPNEVPARAVMLPDAGEPRVVMLPLKGEWLP